MHQYSEAMMFGRTESPEASEFAKRRRNGEENFGRSSVRTMDREGVLAALGYKPEKSWKTSAVLLEKFELCIRCGKKVYPVEKVDVGGLYHRSCFKCKACNVQLNLRTFHRDVDPLQPKATKEIYCKAHVPRAPASHVDTNALEIRRALDAQKQASSHMRGVGYEHPSHYSTEALEFQHQAKSMKRRKKVRRRSTLRSYQDFEKFGVFDAQSTLEELHRKEEDELYKQMSADRKRHVDKLERHLADEMKRTVAELTAWFDKRGASEQERASGLRKIENFYRQQREERILLLLDRLTMEEQAAVARMIEKHSQEMLILIQEKEREAEKAMRFEFNESELLDESNDLLASDRQGDEYYNGVEEWQEDGEESQEDVTESFSEASYRVEQCENMSGVIQQDDYRGSSPGLIRQSDYQAASKQSGHVHGNVRRQNDGEGKPERPQIGTKTSDREGSRGQGQSLDDNSQTSDNNRQPVHANPTGSESQAKRPGRQPESEVKRPGRQPESRSFQADGGELADWGPAVHSGDRQPYPLRPLAENNTGKSLSEQLLYVDPPFEYLQCEGDENGAVVVKVHAAQDARLIDERLRSHHYCTSPTSKRTFYDLSKSPKPHRPTSRSSPADVGRSRSADSPTTRGHDGKMKKSNTSGRYMMFQRPEDVRDVDSSEEEQGIGGSSIFLNNKHGRSRGDRKMAIGEHVKEEERYQKSRSASHDQLHMARSSCDSLTAVDPEERFRDLAQSEAPRARDALRMMSHGIGDDSDQLPGGLFPDPSPIAPKVAPPNTKKSALYTNPSVFKVFDENAIKETKREHKTFTDLVRQLSKHCESELQRVRSIFRWITAKDLNKLQFADNVDSDTPMGLLRGIKLGIESYHNLFKRLCSYAGLHCEIIEGYSKGAGYKPGSRLQGNAFRNQWTAVFVDGSWRFVNCNWGARHVKGPRDEQMTYKCDEFYFLTDPEEHIYQHFPDHPDWQLLPKPISLDQFVRLPLLKSPFFNLRLALAADYESVIHSSEGSVEIRIMSPMSLGFAAQLKSKDGRVRPEVLQDRVLVRRIREEVIFLANVPSTGKYLLEIYCGDRVDAESMDNVCAFRICCYGLSPNPHLSFPPTPCFGRTAAFAEFDVAEETHSDPYVIPGGQLLIAFLCPSTVRLSHSLARWNHRDRRLENFDRYAFAVHRSEHVISYVIHCPKRGGYVLSLFASDERITSPKCIYRYYIECLSPIEHSFPLPKASKRWQYCRLVEPLNGDLPLRTRVRFRIESSVAVEIVINLKGIWHRLKRSGNMWQGTVNTGEDNTKLSIYGRFENKEKYVPLLEYQVKNLRTLEELKSLTKYV